MFEFIEKIRQKPERTKKQIAFLTSFFFSGVIFVVWLSIIYPGMKKDEVASDSDTSVTPSSAISSTFSGGFSGIISEFKKIRESISLLGTDPAYYVSTTTSTSSDMTASVYEGDNVESPNTNEEKQSDL